MLKHLSKKIRIILLIIFWSLSIALAFYYAPALKTPITTAGPITYVVNVQKIWEDLPATKQLQEDLQKILGRYHDQLSKTEEALKTEHRSLMSAQKNTMSAQDLQILETRKNLFESKVAQTQKDVEEKQHSISQRHQQATHKLHAIIQEKVKEVAEEKGAEIILSTQNVMYSEPGRDLTAQVYAKVKAATLNFKIA